jgi:hypothetical protein
VKHFLPISAAAITLLILSTPGSAANEGERSPRFANQSKVSKEAVFLRKWLSLAQRYGGHDFIGTNVERYQRDLQDRHDTTGAFEFLKALRSFRKRHDRELSGQDLVRRLDAVENALTLNVLNELEHSSQLWGAIDLGELYLVKSRRPTSSSPSFIPEDYPFGLYVEALSPAQKMDPGVSLIPEPGDSREHPPHVRFGISGIDSLPGGTLSLRRSHPSLKVASPSPNAADLFGESDTVSWNLDAPSQRLTVKLLADQLYLHGTAGHSAELELVHEHEGVTSRDTIRFHTPVLVALTVPGLDYEEKMISGLVLLVNNDDDDGDGSKDDGPGGDVEDDVMPMHLDFDRSLVTQGMLTLSRAPGWEDCKEWRSDPSLQPGLEVQYEALDLSQSLSWNLATETVPDFVWVEGANVSDHAKDGWYRLTYAHGEDVHQDEIPVTVADVLLQPITPEGTPLDVNPSCIVKGKTGRYMIEVLPSDLPEEFITWRPGGLISQGVAVPATWHASFPSGSAGREIEIRGNRLGGEGATVHIRGLVTSRPPRIGFFVIEPRAFDVSFCIIKDESGKPAFDESKIPSMLAAVNELFEQAGITFRQAGDVLHEENEDWIHLENVGTHEHQKYDHVELCKTIPAGHGFEVYFVNTIEDALGFNTSSGICVESDVSPNVLAHELGHALGLKDIYITRTGADLGTVALSSSLDLQYDASGEGRNTRFYPSPFGGQPMYRRDLIKRLLMCGVQYGDVCHDIPLGFVRGLNRDKPPNDTLIKVGHIGIKANPRHH